MSRLDKFWIGGERIKVKRLFRHAIVAAENRPGCIPEITAAKELDGMVVPPSRLAADSIGAIFDKRAIPYIVLRRTVIALIEATVAIPNERAMNVIASRTLHVEDFRTNASKLVADKETVIRRHRRMSMQPRCVVKVRNAM